MSIDVYSIFCFPESHFGNVEWCLTMGLWVFMTGSTPLLMGQQTEHGWFGSDDDGSPNVHFCASGHEQLRGHLILSEKTGDFARIFVGEPWLKPILTMVNHGQPQQFCSFFSGIPGPGWVPLTSLTGSSLSVAGVVRLEACWVPSSETPWSKLGDPQSDFWTFFKDTFWAKFKWAFKPTPILHKKHGVLSPCIDLSNAILLTDKGQPKIFWAQTLGLGLRFQVRDQAHEGLPASRAPLPGRDRRLVLPQRWAAGDPLGRGLHHLGPGVPTLRGTALFWLAWLGERRFAKINKNMWLKRMTHDDVVVVVVVVVVVDDDENVAMRSRTSASTSLASLDGDRDLGGDSKRPWVLVSSKWSFGVRPCTF